MNLSKTRYFNIVIIVIALVLRFYNLITGYGELFGYALNLASLLGLLSGLAYVLYGYKKDSAVYYKGFMFLFLLSCLLDACSEFLVDEWSILTISIKVIRLIPLFLLAFAKDFGKTKSLICSYIVLGLCLFLFVEICVVYGLNIDYIGLALSSLVMSIVTCSLVSAKYKDKQARGSK